MGKAFAHEKPLLDTAADPPTLLRRTVPRAVWGQVLIGGYEVQRPPACCDEDGQINSSIQVGRHGFRFRLADPTAITSHHCVSSTRAQRCPSAHQRTYQKRTTTPACRAPPTRRRPRRARPRYRHQRQPLQLATAHVLGVQRTPCRTPHPPQCPLHQQYTTCAPAVPQPQASSNGVLRDQGWRRSCDRASAGRAPPSRVCTPHKCWTGMGRTGKVVKAGVC